jgi:hypothetical protein
VCLDKEDEQDSDSDDLFNPGVTTIQTKKDDKGNTKPRELKKLLEDSEIDLFDQSDEEKPVKKVQGKNPEGDISNEEDDDEDLEKEFEKYDMMSGEELAEKWANYNQDDEEGVKGKETIELKSDMTVEEASAMSVEEVTETDEGFKRRQAEEESYAKYKSI